MDMPLGKVILIDTHHCVVYFVIAVFANCLKHLNMFQMTSEDVSLVYIFYQEQFILRQKQLVLHYNY